MRLGLAIGAFQLTNELAEAFPWLGPSPIQQQPVNAMNAARHNAILCYCGSNRDNMMAQVVMTPEKFEYQYDLHQIAPYTDKHHIRLVTATRVFTSEEFEYWKDELKQGHVRMAETQTEARERFSQRVKQASETNLQLSIFRGAVLDDADLLSDKADVWDKWITVAEDPRTTYQWGLQPKRPYEVSGLLELWAAAIWFGDPRFRDVIWRALAREPDPAKPHTRCKKVYGMIQCLVARMPAGLPNTSLDDVLQWLTRMPVYDRVEPTFHSRRIEVKDVDPLELLYFDPTRVIDAQTVTAVLGKVDPSFDPDLVFQRAFSVAILGINEREANHRPAMGRPVGGYRAVTYAMTRDPSTWTAFKQKVLDKLPPGNTESRTYVILDSMRWCPEHERKELFSPTIGVVEKEVAFVAVIYRNSIRSMDIFSMHYGKASVPPELKFEEDYEEWEIPDDRALLRVTHCGVFRHFVFPAYEHRTEFRDSAPQITSHPIRLTHTQRALPMTVLPYVL